MAHVSLLLARTSLVALAVSIAGAAGPAFAHSSGGSGSGGGASTPSCKPGYVYVANKRTCVKASSMNDEQLYHKAYTDFDDVDGLHARLGLRREPADLRHGQLPARRAALPARPRSRSRRSL